MAFKEIEFPPYIETLSERAWYMRNHLGMTYREIGEVLHKSDMTIARRLREIDDRRYRKSTVFKRFHSYCSEECEDHDCHDCKLFRFVVTKLVG